MALSFSTRWLPEGPERLALGAARAREMGFSAVHAARPPKDAAKGKAALAELGLTLSSLEATIPERVDSIPSVVDAAAGPAAILKRPLVVLDLQALVADARETAEGAIVRVSRTLHQVFSRWSGLQVALRAAHLPGRLLGFREMDWLLADNLCKPVGLWMDPARALALERAQAGPPPLDWADRFGSRTLGIAVHGLGAGSGHVRPEEAGLDWGTLRGLLPANAPRVLDVGPSLTSADVIDVRRRFEEMLGW